MIQTYLYLIMTCVEVFLNLLKHEELTRIYSLHDIIIYMKLLLDTKFDKRKDQQIKGLGERTDNRITFKLI